jgi:hypothetical protein
MNRISLKNRRAVSETVGEILLLAIAVTSVSLLYTQFSGFQGPQDIANVTIIGKIEQGTPVFELQRGESLAPDAEIILQIEGQYGRTIRTSIQELSTRFFWLQDGWDIGEKIFNISDDLGDLSGRRIDATIVDRQTNAIVFWGRLQEGYALPPFGRGGIWHLDEGSGAFAMDSSGNNNHGIVHGSQWIYGKKNYALLFNYNPNDYVRAPSGPGLQITDEITVEAWINPIRTPDGILDNFSFDIRAKGITWIHISGDIFAFAFWHPGVHTNCRVQTVNLSPSGQIGDQAIDSIDFISDGSANGFDPDFIHIDGSVYAIAHRFDKDDGFVTTLHIHENGTISDTIIDRYRFEGITNAYYCDIIHVSGDVYAIAASEGLTDRPGYLTTVEIAPNGTIRKSIIDRFEFEPDDCSFPRLAKISDTNYLLVYSSSNNGYATTIKIENNGTINKTLIDSFEFESDRCFETDLQHVSSSPSTASNIYAIAYRGKNDNGYVATIDVKNNGTIVNNTISILKFDPSVYGGQPDIERTEGTNNIFAIAYLGPLKQGYLTTIQIFDNGTISDTIVNTIRFTPYDNEQMEPTIVHHSGTIYGIAFTGKGGYGYLITLSITYTGEIKGMIGQGGIFKDNSYALIANATKAFGTINNITINVSGILANHWNHIALTYDGSFICLYINNDLCSVSTSYPYNNKINFTDDALYFGYLFFGALDEIAIYDRALTPQEINEHYLYPGALE